MATSKTLAARLKAAQNRLGEAQARAMQRMTDEHLETLAGWDPRAPYTGKAEEAMKAFNHYYYEELRK